MFKYLLSFAFSLLLPLQTLEASTHDFIPADEAFVVTASKNETSYSISWNIAPEHYLYKTQFNISLNDKLYSVTFPDGTIVDDLTFGEVEVFYDNVSFNIPNNDLTTEHNNLLLVWQGCSNNGICFAPQTLKFDLNNLQNGSQIISIKNKKDDILSLLTSNPISPELEKQEFDLIPYEQETSIGFLNLSKSDSLPYTLLIAFLLGIGLSFTPCVLPMIPIMSSIIVGKNHNKKTALKLTTAYVLPMIVIYSLIGLLVSYVGYTVQSFLQNTYTILFISILFLFLSLSMFGFYNIQMPNFIRNKFSQYQSKEHNISSAMGLGAVSAIISSPCITAPLAAVLLFIAQIGDPVIGFSILLSMSFGMSIILIVFGLFGSKAIPKTGNWIHFVKVFFAISMLFMSIYMLDKIYYFSLFSMFYILFISSLVLIYISLKNDGFITNHKKSSFISFLIFITITSFYFGFDDNHLFSNKKNNNENLFYQSNNLNNIRNELNPEMINVIYFTADWCSTCQVINSTILTDGTYSELQRKGINLLKLDVTTYDNANLNFMNKHKIIGTPSLLKVDMKLNALKTHIGDFSKEQLVNF